MDDERIDPKIMAVYLVMLKGMYINSNYTIAKHIYFIAIGLANNKDIQWIINQLLRA